MTRPLALFLVLVSIVALPCMGVWAEQAPQEYQVKAAFLYNFIKFIDWPPEALARPGGVMVLCVLGEDLFGPALSEMNGRPAKDRKLLVKRIRSLSESDVCHILFVSASEKERVPHILKEVRDSAVLTVGEADRFTERGGVINFVMEDNKIRFEISGAAAQRAGLRISSKLMSLSR